MIGMLKELLCYLRYQLPRIFNRSELNKVGFVQLSQDKLRLNAKEIERIVKRMDSVSIDPAGVKVWSDELGADRRIHGFENLFPFSKNFLDNVVAIAEQHHTKPLSHYSVLAAKLTFREENLGSGGGWHRDSAHRSQVKIIVYLSDVDDHNGPFEYLPGTHWSWHKLKTDGFGSSKLRFTEKDVRGMDIQPITLTGRAGSGLVVDTKGIHRGRPIASGNRYALTFYFFDNGEISPNIFRLINGSISSCRS